jgi:hypothetical protein
MSMKSVDNLIKVAEKFTRKLSLAQVLQGEDPKAVVADAFFGSTASGKDERFFQNYILGQGSKFSAALPDSVNTVDIGATVDAKSGAANFLVAVNPANTKVRAALIGALIQDYTAAYGAAPAARLADRVAKGQVKPDVHQTAPSIIQIK